MRNDTHRPSAIDPSEYEYVAQEFLKVEDLGSAEFLKAEREAIRRHTDRTGGKISSHEHGGNCMVCGSVHAVYTILFHHRPTNTYVRMGADCAQKCEMGGEFDSNRFRAAVKDARLAQAGKRKAQALLADAGLSQAWDVYTTTYPCTCGWAEWQRAETDSWKNGTAAPEEPNHPCNCPRPHKEEMTILDIVSKLVRYGSVSENSLKYVHALLERIANRAEREAAQAAEAEAAADCPSGRVEIEGVVLTVRVDKTPYGTVTKMLLKADSGFKVWGSRPSGTNVERGDRLAFSAKVEPSHNDPKFGFYSRPTKARVISQASSAA